VVTLKLKILFEKSENNILKVFDHADCKFGIIFYPWPTPYAGVVTLNIKNYLKNLKMIFYRFSAMLTAIMILLFTVDLILTQGCPPLLIKH
jgi:hypothetical protein